MKKLFVLILFLWACLSVSAQNTYFIYLESENNLPFYVRIVDKVYSSSSLGFLVLPDLADSNYTVFVGFPSSQMSESKFTLNLKGADRGFIIKKSESNFYLSDIQTSDIINTQKDQTESNITYQAQSNAFTSLLAKAAGDSSLLLVPIFAKVEPGKKEEKKKPVVSAPDAQSQTEVKAKQVEAPPAIEESKTQKGDIASLSETVSVKHATDSLFQKTAQVQTEVALHTKEDIKDKNLDSVFSDKKRIDTLSQTPLTEAYVKSTVKKHSENSTTEGFGLTFIDKDGSAIDTIQLLIPNPKISFKEISTSKDDNLVVQNKDSIQNSQDIKQNIGTAKKEDVNSNVLTEKKPVDQNPSATNVVKTSCENMATENDFFKLRKNMAAQQTDEAMVDEAKKFFKNKCYTTGQIKYLSALFLTSAGKYQFFDAAYMHVSDPEKFASLQSEIKDDYYMRRFKALIGE